MIKQPEAHRKSLIQYYKQDKNLVKKKKIKSIEEGEILYIDNYFSDQLCDQLVEQVNKLGFIDAPLTVGIGKGLMDKSVRDCQRVMVDDFQVAELLYKQFLDYAPLCCEGAYMWGVNERFRYLYYNKNGIFKAHYDGRYPSNKREFSMFTVHFYLNTVEKGGGTSFYSDKWNQPKVVDSIKGRVAIFRQNEWLHQGDKVEIGEKYTVRNELMYRYLNNDEIKQIPKQQCNVCQKQVQFNSFQDCEHKYAQCGCSMFGKSSKQKPRCYVCEEQKYNNIILKQQLKQKSKYGCF